MEFLDAIQPLADAGISVVLAVVVIYWYRSDTKERIANADEQARQETERLNILARIISDNTKAQTETVETLRSLREIVVRFMNER